MAGIEPGLLRQPSNDLPTVLSGHEREYDGTGEGYMSTWKHKKTRDLKATGALDQG